MLLSRQLASSEVRDDERSRLREKVERVGDLTWFELMEPLGPWPREKVERVGEGMVGALWLCGKLGRRERAMFL